MVLEDGREIPASLIREQRHPHADSRSNGVRLVVGASGGIGLALVRAQLQDPLVRQVIATYRGPSVPQALRDLTLEYGGRILLHPLDVTDPSSLAAFEDFIKNRKDGVDLAVHAAGILWEQDLVPEKSLADCQAGDLKRWFEVNSVGPLMVASTLIPAHSRNRRFTFAVLSAMLGSIGDNRLGGWYGYRASKTALNQFIRTLANECRVKHPNASIIAIHPGTTDTDLSRPFQRNVRPDRLYTPEQTAKRILGVLAKVQPGQTGMFLNWDGSTIPW